MRRRRIDDQGSPTPPIVLPNTLDDALIGQVSRDRESQETLRLSLGVAIYDPHR